MQGAQPAIMAAMDNVVVAPYNNQIADIASLSAL
jgi:hypothetical protein